MNILFYTLSKILPNLFLPLGLSFIYLIKNLKSRKKNYSIFLIFFLYIFSIKITSQILLNFVEYPGIHKDINKLPNVDAVVVLSGGGVNDFKNIEHLFKWNNAKRFLAGIEIFKSNKADILLFTGGKSPFSEYEYSEGEIYEQAAVKYGINPKHIFVTDPVFNTFSESKKVKKQLSILNKKNKRPKIILVTSGYHMPRAKFLFNKQNIDVESFPVDFMSSLLTKSEIIRNPISWIPNAKDLYNSSLAIREIMGRIFYIIVYR